MGDWALAATTCNQLANVATLADRPIEAEGWYKRALVLDERVQPDSRFQAGYCNNLANLLVNEVRAGRALITRLAEARGYAERALAIMETLDASSEIWKTLQILADIAELEGKTETARTYRRRERETFAAFAGNRYHIDRQHGQLIADIAAAKGDAQAREAVEEVLPELEANGWHIAAATQRIWAGERDWHSLVEDIDRNSALLVLRVLETIADPNSIQPTEAQDRTPEQVIASLPAAIREAVERGDEAAFKQAMGALSPEEQQVVREAMRYLQGQAEPDDEDGGDALQQLEPLLQAIAVVAGGDSTHRSEIEEVLTDLETQDCHIRKAVQRIWAGERDATSLTAGLDEIDGALVRRVLEIIGGGG